jgi:glucose-6-phosphate isomerase
MELLSLFFGGIPSFLGSGLSLLIAVGGGVLAMLGLFFKAKHDGRKEARNEIERKSYKAALDAETSRRGTDNVITSLSDPELDRLRAQYETD